ncbi:DinB family protein [Hymenobacter sp. HSC-4F20]|uniref:DinB family protein n=1 Tax=Hymenobacter sp. HSC-4F20 TaxID=2864135 RepID=UPI001C732AE3|nr:DinB family protein [Hymenobacter sp. HSC-4F20]MBX0293107.1 DinB family protein [Hymenobacter sp. HSC-4F20]
MEQQTRQFRLLTDWYLSVLEGVQPADGCRTLSEHNNSLEWLAGHLLVTRSRNLARLGGPTPEWSFLDAYVDPTLPLPGFRPFDSNRIYPSLAECTSAWERVSQTFLATLQAAEERVLQTVLPLSGPTGGHTLEDLLVSVVLHEAFHIGQMSIIRKALGYPAMYWFMRPVHA